MHNRKWNVHSTFRILSFLTICSDLRGPIFRFQWENIFGILNWLSSLGLDFANVVGKTDGFSLGSLSLRQFGSRQLDL